MKRFVRALDLRDGPDVVETYVAHHRAVWPQVEASLRRIGIRGLEIYLLGRRLVMVMETDDGFDPERAFAPHMADPTCREWEELMKTFQQRAPGAGPDEWWADMKEVYRLEGTGDA